MTQPNQTQPPTLTEQLSGLDPILKVYEHCVKNSIRVFAELTSSYSFEPDTIPKNENALRQTVRLYVWPIGSDKAIHFFYQNGNDVFWDEIDQAAVDRQGSADEATMYIDKIAQECKNEAAN